jgi:hypothetical protein
LSDKKSGYDLALEIKKALPKTGVIVMLGTFDTVDENKFSEFGIDDKIIKPFESTKFIKKVKEIIEKSADETFEYKPKNEVKAEHDQSAQKEIELNSWVVDAPKIEVLEKKIEQKSTEIITTALDPLKSEIQGWGFNSELEEKHQKVFPPIIEEAPAPDVLSRLQSSSTFVENLTNDDTKPTFQVPAELNKNLLTEIENEVSAEAFWAVDEVVAIKSVESDNISDTKLDEVTADLTDAVRNFNMSKEIEEELNYSELTYCDFDYETRLEEKKLEFTSGKVEMGPHLNNVNIDELVEKLKMSLLPQIETMIKDHCKDVALKVAWEVIPDLAENLIKKEIKEISASIN